MNFEDYETLPTQSSITHMTAGAIAGVMEHCVMYPLDSVKTRMQSLRSAHNGSIAETFRYMVQREGLLRYRAIARSQHCNLVGCGCSRLLSSPDQYVYGEVKITFNKRLKFSYRPHLNVQTVPTVL